MVFTNIYILYLLYIYSKLLLNTTNCMLYVLYKSITIQSNYQLQCTYYTIYNEYCKLISSPQVKLA